MIKHNQEGAASSGLIIASLSVLCLLALVFGGWAYSGRQHYKNDSQGLISAAVKTAVAQSVSAQNAQFAQAEQFPLSTYNGPAAYGSMIIQYPKNWSGEVDNGGNNAFEAFFAPGVLPSVTDQSSIFALTVQVLNQAYTDVVSGIQSSPGVTISAYALPKVKNLVGVEVSGPIGPNQTQQTMIILPLRTNTLEIATDGSQNLSAFNSIILPNFSFSP